MPTVFGPHERTIPPYPLFCNKSGTILKRKKEKTRIARKATRKWKNLLFRKFIEE